MRFRDSQNVDEATLPKLSEAAANIRRDAIVVYFIGSNDWCAEFFDVLDAWWFARFQKEKDEAFWLRFDPGRSPANGVAAWPAVWSAVLPAMGADDKDITEALAAVRAIWDAGDYANAQTDTDLAAGMRLLELALELVRPRLDEPALSVWKQHYGGERTCRRRRSG